MKQLYIILFLFFLAECYGKERVSHVFADDQQIMVGDSAIWSTKDYDDRHWPFWDNDVPTDKIFWVRSSSFFPKLESHKQLGMRITATGAFDIFWDGVYMGSNGVLGMNGQKEVPGKYIYQLLLPDSLTLEGKHTLALRCTKQFDIGQHVFYYVDDYYEIVTGPLHISKYMFFIGGMFFLAAIYFLLLFLGTKNDYPFLIFSIICTVFVGLLMLEYCKMFYFYDYTFQRIRLQIIGYLHVALSFLIPLFFALEFKFQWKKYLLILLAIGVFIIEYKYQGSYDSAAVIQNRMMWCFSFGIVLFSAFRKIKEAYIAIIGFIGSYLVFLIIPLLDVNYVSDYDVALFASFLCIVLSMLYILSYKRKEQRKAYQESLVVSERLKNELLKKNIKPHFIMNTLTSLIDWVEDSPKEGVKFIHALADEFDVLNEIADHKLVPIEQEIKLCKNHLKVMGFRKEVKYTWMQNGIDNNEIIPPAILHTIVENGVTHSRPDENGEIMFILKYSKNKNEKSYTLCVKGEVDQSIIDSGEINITIGTGTKYIKSRLTESYGNRWSYKSEPFSEGWKTTITILE